MPSSDLSLFLFKHLNWRGFTWSLNTLNLLAFFTCVNKKDSRHPPDKALPTLECCAFVFLLCSRKKPAIPLGHLGARCHKRGTKKERRWKESWLPPSSQCMGALMHLPMLLAGEKCLQAPLPGTVRRYQPCLAPFTVTSPQAQYYLFTIKILITLCFSYVLGCFEGEVGEKGGLE